ncbi:MAG TPA: gamma carbonic anhydrase family protein [Chloroflexota bacterium]|nr:gamma carbonic anhydrase family protein [Chloroflexota bacterium]
MIVEFDGYVPRVAETAFVAPTAVLIGNVVVEDEASIWYGAVLRGDHGEQAIVIGARSSVQDNCVIHVAFDKGTTIGEDVTIGHGAILEACEVGAGALVGMNTVVLEHARIGARVLVAANSTVLAHTEIPPDTLAAGSPARVKKTIDGGAAWWIEHSAKYYVELSRKYKEQGLE